VAQNTNVATVREQARRTRVRDEEAAWVENRTGAVVNTAFIAAALGVARRPPVRETASFLRRIARNPRFLVPPARALGAELGRVASGRSELEPARGDRRYADPAWRTNRWFRALAQAHTAASTSAEEVLDRAALDPADDYRLRLAVQNATAAVSPANLPLTNPGALKAAIDTAGLNLVRGAVRFLHDVRRPPRLPLRSDEADFVLGVDVAATPGAVVQRTPLTELIQYAERTRQVHVEPVLIVPSFVNKFYLTDMSPGRSLVEHGVRNGYQMFSLSWVNPDGSHRDYGLDDYVASIIEAIETTRVISGSDRVHVLGVCAGGQLTSIALSHLAATGRSDLVASLTLLVCVLDYTHSGLPQGLLTRESAEIAAAQIHQKGFFDGRDMTLALAWLRPIDSVWWPFTQRYLLGSPMPRLDLFHWSEDVTNLPAAFVRDQLYLTLENALAYPGTLEVLGEPVDLSAVRHDAYLVAGLTDHLTPWEACYQTTQLLGSTTRFVLVDGGHIQSIIRPPGERVIPFLHGDAVSASAAAWKRRAERAEESWWDDWIGWLDDRSSDYRPQRRKLGGRGYPALDPAPGIYVRRRADHL
jgi:polyhydroxyalkanoate synthase subunit PhaC